MNKLKLKRYFGIVKLKKGEKHCWISKEDKNGWSLGFALNSRTIWIKGIRFVSRQEVLRAISSKIVFVHLKNSKK